MKLTRPPLKIVVYTAILTAIWKVPLPKKRATIIMTEVEQTLTNKVVKNARKRGVNVFHRDQWGSRQEEVYHARRVNKPVAPGVFGHYKVSDMVVQHITVTHNTRDMFADMRLVEKIGMERFGSGVSYNFVIDMITGEVCVGQPLDAKGTHTVNTNNVPGFPHDLNYTARAIAFLGMPGDKLFPAAEEAAVQLMAAMVEERAIAAKYMYHPHSKFAPKSCPTDNVRRRMRAMRRRVDTAVKYVTKSRTV